MPRIPVLTIDGPSGSGKGTISRAVAERLGWHYLDSGALYRAVGLAAAWEVVDLSDPEAVAQCARRTEIRFETQGSGEPHVIVNGKDATRQLRTETAGAAASAIAAHRQGIENFTGIELDEHYLQTARERIEACWDRIEAHLAKRGPYLLGASASAADFHLTMLMRWSRNMPRPATDWPNLAALAQRLKSRPSIKMLYEREGLTEWA